MSGFSSWHLLLLHHICLFRAGWLISYHPNYIAWSPLSGKKSAHIDQRILTGRRFSAFQVVSSYTNTGMSLEDASMVPFQQAYPMIVVMIILILAGNTAFVSVHTLSPREFVLTIDSKSLYCE